MSEFTATSPAPQILTIDLSPIVNQLKEMQTVLEEIYKEVKK